MKFRSSNSGPKRVAVEEIIEVEDLAAKQQKLNDSANNTEIEPKIGSFKKPQINRSGFVTKSSLANLVKRKPQTQTATSASGPSTSTTSGSSTKTDESTSKPSASATNALSLLSGYDNNTDSDESE